MLNSSDIFHIKPFREIEIKLYRTALPFAPVSAGGGDVCFGFFVVDDALIVPHDRQIHQQRDDVGIVPYENDANYGNDK